MHVYKQTHNIKHTNTGTHLSIMYKHVTTCMRTNTHQPTDNISREQLKMGISCKRHAKMALLWKNVQISSYIIFIFNIKIRYLFKDCCSSVVKDFLVFCQKSMKSWKYWFMVKKSFTVVWKKVNIIWFLTAEKLYDDLITFEGRKVLWKCLFDFP